MLVNPIAFRVSSQRQDRDAAEVGAALTYRKELSGGRSLDVNATYRFDVSAHARTHSLWAGVALGF